MTQRQLVTLTGFLLFAHAVGAAAPEITITVGFADRFRSGFITPVTVMVRNPDHNLRGELILTHVSGTALREGDRYIVRQPVTITADLPGVFRFCLPLEASSYPLSARLEQNGHTVAAAEAELRPRNTEQPLIVGLSRRPSLDALLPVMAKRFDRMVEIAYPRSEELPILPEGWEGVASVLWHDWSPDLVDGRSAEALSRWIRGGGELIIIGGPWLAGRSFPPSLPLGRVGWPSPARNNSASPALYTPLSEPSRRVGKSPDQYWEYDHGRGRILYIPHNVFSRPPDGRRPLWNALAERPPAARGWDGQEVENLLSTLMLRDFGPLPPPITSFLYALGIFFLTATVLLLIRGGKKGGGLMQMAALVLVSAAVSILIVLRMGEMERTALGRVELYFPSKRVERIRLISSVSHEVPLRLPPGGIPQRLRGGDTVVQIEASGAALKGLRVQPWTAVDVRVLSTLSGEEPMPWRDAVRIRGGRVSPLPAAREDADEIPRMGDDSPRGYYFRLAEEIASILHPDTGLLMAWAPMEGAALPLRLKITPEDAP